MDTLQLAESKRSLVYSDHSLVALLDELLRHRSDEKWRDFYTDRAKPCPFFLDTPDENLVQWIDDGLVADRGLALDIGCGNARNSIYLAQHGFTVDAVDYSESAIAWARERVAAADEPASTRVRLHQQSIFNWTLAEASYDLVCDSGCFHHLAPHRRRDYVNLVLRALKPGGVFSLVCFRPEGGSGLSDLDVYEQRTLGGGLGYDESQLRLIWSNGLQIECVRQMRKCESDSGMFGEHFLWILRARLLAATA